MKKVALSLIRWYQGAISPFALPACRYTPSCSRYAYEAIERFGPWRGSWMATKRLFRCHPFSAGGYDPPSQTTL